MPMNYAAAQVDGPVAEVNVRPLQAQSLRYSQSPGGDQEDQCADGVLKFSKKLL